MSNTLKGKELLAEEEVQDIDYDNLDYNGDTNPPSLGDDEEMDHSKDSGKYTGTPTLGEMRGLAELKEKLDREAEDRKAEMTHKIHKLCYNKLVGDGSRWTFAVGIFYGGLCLIDEPVSDGEEEWREECELLRDGQTDKVYFISTVTDRNITLVDLVTFEERTHQIGGFQFW